jgi:hypothetical protein
MKIACFIEIIEYSLYVPLRAGCAGRGLPSISKVDFSRALAGIPPDCLKRYQLWEVEFHELFLAFSAAPNM